MSLDNLLWFAGFLVEVAVVGLLAYKRVWRTFPVFFAYCIWGPLSDCALYLIEHAFPGAYIATYGIFNGLDSALQFSVLIELAWSVLRPIRASLPRGTVIAVGLLVLAVGAAIWPLSGINLGGFPPEVRNPLRLLQTASILRIVFFLVLAGCSQLLSIGWRDRELQIATGLGLYSLVSLSVTVLHIQQSLQNQYHLLDQFVVIGYLVSYAYWIFSFAQKEAERREFTPQMEGFLLALAGTARTARVSLVDSVSNKNRDRHN